MKEYWYGPELGYHEGDPLRGDVSVPERPGVGYEWDGQQWNAVEAPPVAPSPDALLRQAVLRVWSQVDPVSASRDPLYEQLAAIDAAPQAAAADPV